MNHWDGAEITSRLGIHPISELPGFWSIHGEWDGQSATGSTTEMVRLAHLILENLDDPRTPGMKKMDWLKEYRTRTGANLRTAMAAWDRRERGRSDGT